MPFGTRRLTNSADETTISTLFSNDLVFSIPYFQRAYKWGDKNIARFESDLENLLDYEDTTHFLGAIIVFGKPTNPSDSDFYEVIDGQQRLTTCYLTLIALAKVFTMHDMLNDAFGLYKKYLVNNGTSSTTNAKLFGCKEDRACMNRIFHDLSSNSEFLHMLQNYNCTYKPMPNTGANNGHAWKNYVNLVKFFDSRYTEHESIEAGAGAEILRNFYGKLVSNMSVVQIIVKDPTDGPKIFDSLNSKQEPMTIGDLIRNEIFAKYAGHDDEEIDTLDRDYWHPFYEKFKQNNNDAFDKVFEQYFFPYVLTINHNVKKADAFSYLREEWANVNNPVEIISALKKYQDIFLDLHYGTNLTECPVEVKKVIYHLSRMETPNTVYPFIMHVVSAVNDNKISVAVAKDILEHIESFLLRRVVCGYEPTGLHATFKALWDDCDGVYTVDNVIANIKRHSTVKWPSDSEFVENLKTRELYKVRMTPYILAEWNGQLGGDVPVLDSQQIEHVLPENPDPSSQWVSDWSKEEREKRTHCLANLLPISGSLNGSIQNADYVEKRHRYIDDSALKAPREFGHKYEKWTPAEFDERAESLANWALARWKY